MRPRELHRVLDSGVRLVDVRTPAEYDSAHIHGSVNVPLDLLRRETRRIADGIPDGAVLVCRSGQRAGTAAALLPGTRVLDGGILAWEGEGLPVRQGAPRWAMERQVRLVAGGLVLLFTAASAFWSPLKVSNTCAMGAMLSRLPYNRGRRVTLGEALSALDSR